MDIHKFLLNAIIKPNFRHCCDVRNNYKSRCQTMYDFILFESFQLVSVKLLFIKSICISTSTSVFIFYKLNEAHDNLI